MNAAAGRWPALRAATWRTLIGLLAVTGMRQGEACRLLGDDADLETGTLVIRRFQGLGQNRPRSWQPTAVVALRAYERARGRCAIPSRRRPRSW